MASVLIVTDTDEGFGRLQELLRRAGPFNCAPARGQADALVRLGRERFDCVVVDHHPPQLDGLSVLGRMGAAQAATPTVFIAPVARTEVVVACMRAGATDFLTRVEALHEGALANRVVEAVEHHQRRGRVHTGRYRDVFRSVLRGETPLKHTERQRASGGDAARIYQTMAETMNEPMAAVDTEGNVVFANDCLLAVCRKARDDVVGQPVGCVFDDASQALASFVNRKLREKQRLQVEASLATADDTPVPVLVSLSPMVDAHDAYVGGLLVMTDLRKLKESERRIVEQNRRLRELANQDGATRLANHRRLHELLDREFRRARRYGDALSCLMLDLDYFKMVNDTHGHPFGDAVLSETARRIKDGLRDLDVAGRYGGEEFLIIMPHTDMNGAHVSAERIRLAIECTPFEHGGRHAWITASVGLATFDAEMSSYRELIGRADQAVYQAKAAGRNRVFAWSEHESVPMLAIVTRSGVGRQADARMVRLAQTLRQVATKTMRRIASEAESVDGFDGCHGQRVGELSTRIGGHMGLPATQTEMIRIAGELHDVGKLAIPPDLLQKPDGLSEGERRLLRRRCLLGQQMLRRVKHLDPEARLIRYLGHAFDGDAESQGLSGEAIPIGARIIAVADAFDSLTHGRPYRSARPADQALATIREQAGTRHDPGVVAALEQVVDAERHLRVLPSEGDTYYPASA